VDVVEGIAIAVEQLVKKRWEQELLQGQKTIYVPAAVMKKRSEQELLQEALRERQRMVEFMIADLQKSADFYQKQGDSEMLQKVLNRIKELQQ
jgi:Uri superfamily endonuclease